MKYSIIGCGNIGSIYAQSIRKYKLATDEEVGLCDHSFEKVLKMQEEGLGQAISDWEKMSSSEVLVLAVKPQDFAAIIPKLKSILHAEMVVVSMMAGITIESMRKHLSHDAVVRAMPNAAVALGQGITGYSAWDLMRVSQLKKAETLLNCTGRTVYFEDEKDLDTVTALSGSGPAFFYYIVQQMIQSGIDMGLKESVASMLVKHTMLGSYHLMNHSNQSLDELIKVVASKGGTTEAGLHFFKEQKLDLAIKGGLKAAAHRASELSIFLEEKLEELL